MPMGALRMLGALAGAAQATALGGLRDTVGLLQVALDVDEGMPGAGPAAGYRTLADSRRAGAGAEHAAVYEAVGSGIGRVPALSHSAEILKYVRSLEHAPSLPEDGCLYLPSNKAWGEFYKLIEHPYPPLFAEMVAHSFYPNCTETALTGAKRMKCTDGSIKGDYRCVGIRHAGIVEHRGIQITVVESDGHVALPRKWKHHIDSISKNRDHQAQRMQKGLPKDKCSKSWLLPEVPESKMLVVPTQFIVCSTDPFHKGITREMLRDQASWMTSSYRGRSTYTEMDFDYEGTTPQVDMQIEFDLRKQNCTPSAADDCYRIFFTRDKECAEEAFADTRFVARHNTDPLGLFTVIFVGSDKSGILGMAEFPTFTTEGSKELVVRVSVNGLRHYASTNRMLGLNEQYDEGDTVVHEAGHSLGLLHTFEGGCKLDGDMVADTHPELAPTYTCSQSSSCGSSDPVHNFMDYTPDYCMSGFTETQKRRVWCVFENYRPKLFEKSLQVLPTEPTEPAPPGDTATSPAAAEPVAVSGDPAVAIHVSVQVHPS